MSRDEYPRPQLVRKNWQNLNGTWEFAFDDDQSGRRKAWYRGEGSFDQRLSCLLPIRQS